MASGSSSKISCGVRQFYNLWRPLTRRGRLGKLGNQEWLLRCLMADYNRWANRQGRSYGYAQVIFSDADVNGNGRKFAAFIRRRFKGTKIVSLGATRSPSTGRNITTWIWSIPHARFVKDPLYPNFPPRYRDGVYGGHWY